MTQLITAAENIGTSLFTYPFAPIMDGTLVPYEIDPYDKETRAKIQEKLGQYDLLCGLKEGPILPEMGANALSSLDFHRFLTSIIKIALRMEPGSEPTDKIKRVW